MEANRVTLDLSMHRKNVTRVRNQNETGAKQNLGRCCGFFSCLRSTSIEKMSEINVPFNSEEDGNGINLPISRNLEEFKSAIKTLWMCCVLERKDINNDICARYSHLMGEKRAILKRLDSIQDAYNDSEEKEQQDDGLNKEEKKADNSLRICEKEISDLNAHSSIGTYIGQFREAAEIYKDACLQSNINRHEKNNINREFGGIISNYTNMK